MSAQREYTGKRLAIMGASYLQVPLIKKAKELGLETHVFAWKTGDVGESMADCFHPISVVEYESIASTCADIGISGICTIASDISALTTNYVATKLGLPGNDWACSQRMTNKHAMRLAFMTSGDPSPSSHVVDLDTDLSALPLTFPMIVKPTDRSGSRGVTKVYDMGQLHDAVVTATELSFEGKAVVEDFVVGQEYSVECLCFEGSKIILSITRKYTTESPHFIEVGHVEPSGVCPSVDCAIRTVVLHALDTLAIRCGAAHAEVKVNDAGEVQIIEIGARMGGDFIGSHLVPLSTGIDYVRAVIDVALGYVPDLDATHGPRAACVRYLLSPPDVRLLEHALGDSSVKVIDSRLPESLEFTMASDSSSRLGYFILEAESVDSLSRYLPPD